jgi:hypothetical protein
MSATGTTTITDVTTSTTNVMEDGNWIQIST